MSDPQKATASQTAAEQTVETSLLDQIVEEGRMALKKLPADLVTECVEVVTPLDAMLRMPGVCGPAAIVPDDATPQAKLVAWLGRNP